MPDPFAPSRTDQLSPTAWASSWARPPAWRLVRVAAKAP